MQYFDHSTHAGDDDAVMALRIEHGGAAVDAYWAIVEKMYREERPVALFGGAGADAGTDWGTNAETKSVSHRLCIGCDDLRSYVSTMLQLGLLKGTPDNLYSDRAMMNITAYQVKAKTARENGKSGGRRASRKPTRKPTRENIGTDAGTDSVATKQNKTKVIGSDRTEPITEATDGAAAAGAAPPVACPVCDAPMERTSAHSGRRRVWRCALCGEELAVEEAA